MCAIFVTCSAAPNSVSRRRGAGVVIEKSPKGVSILLKPILVAHHYGPAPKRVELIQWKCVGAHSPPVTKSQ